MVCTMRNVWRYCKELPEIIREIWFERNNVSKLNFMMEQAVFQV